MEQKIKLYLSVTSPEKDNKEAIALLERLVDMEHEVIITPRDFDKEVHMPFIETPEGERLFGLNVLRQYTGKQLIRYGKEQLNKEEEAYSSHCS